MIECFWEFLWEHVSSGLPTHLQNSFRGHSRYDFWLIAKTLLNVRTTSLFFSQERKIPTEQENARFLQKGDDQIPRDILKTLEKQNVEKMFRNPRKSWKTKVQECLRSRYFEQKTYVCALYWQTHVLAAFLWCEVLESQVTVLWTDTTISAPTSKEVIWSYVPHHLF